MIKAFPKIFAIGTDYIRDIFDGTVEVTEKIDGSQFDFGKVNGELFMRSKGKMIIPDAPEKMFNKAVDYVQTVADLMPNNTVFYSEYLKTERHNTLHYGRVPRNNLMLFGVSDTFGSKFNMGTAEYSDILGIEHVPVIHYGQIGSASELVSLLETESILGGCKIEGVVVKNYAKQFLLGGQPMPLMMGKFVSEAFKETNQKTWKGEKTGKGKWETFCEGYRTEPRWHKTIQHLRDSGDLENSPRDIGKLIKEIQRDIIEEEKPAIMEFLFKEFGGELLRKAIGGFPEWYKQQLLERSFID
jgi:hypothetical protein